MFFWQCLTIKLAKFSDLHDFSDPTICFQPTSMPFIPTNRAPFRPDSPGRHAPIPAFVTDPDTDAQVPAGIDMVILDTP